MAGKFSNEYKELLDSMSQQTNFSYLGQIEQTEVNNLIANSDVFVNTSVSEGFANTFIQSWLRGIPVLSMHVDPSQLIKQRQLGIVAPTVRKMKSSIELLLEYPEIFEAMGDKARVYAEANHGLKNIDKIKKLMGFC
jgi:glycosyltransferase involved in cell wall biosynthesis